ncbi:MAG TPA: STAS domain-containing protein [Acidobacteriaceae bacterium]|nr:STAS domain-containing protein [Acidobacteriaceae bacterium]
MSLESNIELLADRAAVVDVSGSMTARSPLKALEAQIQELMLQGVVNIVLDLSKVDYVDSAGLGVLMHAYNKLHQKGGSLRLCGVQPRLRKILHTTHTDTLLPVDGSRQDGIAAVRQLSPPIPGR